MENFHSYHEEAKVYFEKPKLGNFDIKIYLDRLIEIFNIVMRKLEFAATLPSVLSHPRVIEILTKEEYKQIVLAFGPLSCSYERYFENAILSGEENSSDWVSLNKNAIDRTKTDNSFQKTNISSDLAKMNVDVFKAFEILSSYPLIQQVSKQNSNNLSKSAISFLRQLKYFMEFVISKTKLMSCEERENELHLRHVVKEIEQTNREVSNLSVLLDEQKLRHQKESEDLLSKWNKYYIKWKRIGEEFNAEHSKILEDSEKNLTLSREKFSENMNELQSSLGRMKESAEKQRANNRKIETNVQGKKFKVESQLLAIITKYDTEIGDRQEIYQELEKEHNELENAKNQLMDEMGEQLNFYNKIISEREEKEFAVFKEKFETFVNNRCAKKIQRWWRAVLVKKQKAKKKKKGKRKK